LDERVNAGLDGELPLADLTPVERRDVELIHAVAAAARADVPAAPDLAPAVLRRIWELGIEAQAVAAPTPPVPVETTVTPAKPGLRALLAGLWQPHQVSFGLRPAWALGMAVLLAGGLLLARGYGTDRDSALVAAAEAPPVYVQFRLEAAGAGRVALAGSFTEWQPQHEMVETRPGVWTLIVALEPGVHDYAFLVDGQRWVVDPVAPAVDDGFGGMNSRLSLLPVTEGTL
jgi:hypothetical protein